VAIAGTVRWTIDPWKPGFKPPSKCPNCKRVWTLVYTGKRDSLGNHIYRCSYCKVFVGAPTDYAYCDFYPEAERLEKDVFYNPCVKCPHREISPTAGVCIHFRKYRWYGELPPKEIKHVESTMRTIPRSRLKPTEPYRVPRLKTRRRKKE